MSARFSAIVLFVAAFVALPLPMVGFDAVVPAARYAQLAGALALLTAQEGTAGMVGTLCGLLAAHALVYTLLLGGGAFALARLVLARLPMRLRDHVTVIVATLLIVLPIYARWYTTPFHHADAHARWLELYR